jgi:hypothetical protein
MENIQTLTQLLKNSGCAYQIFDLGRRILPLEQGLFSRVEQGQQPYPYPLKREGQLAIAYWNEQRQPWIWFLRFPLDERGLFKQADIGRFIQYVVEAMGTRLGQDLDEKQQQKLANNPYVFKPSEEKMAVFHSQIRAQLSLPTSQYYQHARDYFAGDLGWDNWQTVGLQGITDICARLSEQQNSPLVIKALHHLPNQPRYALLGALEHQPLGDRLANTLFELLTTECRAHEPDLFLISAYIRALAGADNKQASQAVELILASPKLSHQEVLVAIAGRTWQVLAEAIPTNARPVTDNVRTETANAGVANAQVANAQVANAQVANSGVAHSGVAQGQPDCLAESFLIRLAQTGNQALFNQIFADLVMLPTLRSVLLPLLHSQPSSELAIALARLQQSITAPETTHKASANGG